MRNNSLKKKKSKVKARGRGIGSRTQQVSTKKGSTSEKHESVASRITGN